MDRLRAGQRREGTPDDTGRRECRGYDHWIVRRASRSKSMQPCAAFGRRTTDVMLRMINICSLKDHRCHASHDKYM